LTEHDDVIKSLLRGAPRLGLVLGPAPARAGPATGSALRAKNRRVKVKGRETALTYKCNIYCIPVVLKLFEIAYHLIFDGAL